MECLLIVGVSVVAVEFLEKIKKLNKLNMYETAHLEGGYNEKKKLLHVALKNTQTKFVTFFFVPEKPSDRANRKRWLSWNNGWPDSRGTCCWPCVVNCLGHQPWAN